MSTSWTPWTPSAPWQVRRSHYPQSGWFHSLCSVINGVGASLTGLHVAEATCLRVNAPWPLASGCQLQRLITPNAAETALLLWRVPDLAEHAEKEADAGPSGEAAAAVEHDGDAAMEEDVDVTNSAPSRQVEGWLDDLRHRHRCEDCQIALTLLCAAGTG